MLNNTKNMLKKILTNEIKEEVLKTPILSAKIQTYYNCHANTIRYWIKEDRPQSTDYNMLEMIWEYKTQNGEKLKLTDLLKIQ